MKNDRTSFHWRPDWENPEVLSVNREPAHSRWGAYDTAERARAAEYGSSPFVQSLNGSWRFRLYDCPEAVDGFYAPAYDDHAFRDIAVPSNWELQGFGEPVYTNIVYPWAADEPDCLIRARRGEKRVPNPPFVPKKNPTGCYRRRFTLPEAFSGREVYLRFEGVETAFYLWINGEAVGFSKDSKLAAEFCITPYLKPGENLLAVEVVRFADSTYLEDQDYWFLSGIYRDVWLIAKPKQHIEDLGWRAEPDLHTGSGRVTAEVRVSRADCFADCRVRVSLYDKNGLAAQGTGPVQAEAEYRTDLRPTANTARVELVLERAALWSPEHPALYTMVAELLDPAGKVLDVESSRFGFRTIEVKDGIVYFNGRRLLVRGVNRHDFCYPAGRTVSREWMLREIAEMKRMNINAVRTCHYPDSPLWYELCDEYGILLVCECNLETHGLNGAATHSARWAPAFLDRASRMVEQLKNHVSIFSWSLGNESGTGPNHAAMYGWIKEQDPTRLCQYEAGQPGKNISDIRGDMYATYDQILRLLADPRDDRPVILVEYLYQIRNAGGGMERFVHLMEEYERFQGGFIWDWQDKCLPGKTADGTVFPAYGGDFGESFVEGPERDGDCPPFMTCNGIVTADLAWKPVAHEVRAGYAPVRFSRPPQPTKPFQAAWDRFVVANRCLDTPLSAFSCTAVLRENGEPVARQELELPDLAPGASREITVELPHQKRPGGIYTIEFSVCRRAETWFAEAGAEVGLFQFPLESGPARPEAPRPAAAPRQETGGGVLTLSAGEIRLRIDLATGEASAHTADGALLLQQVRPCFDRPYTGLDATEDWGWYEEYRKVRGQRFVFGTPRVLSGCSETVVEVPFYQQEAGRPDIHGRVRYALDGDGVLTLEGWFHLDRAYLAVPRVGLECVLPGGMEEFSYFGRGGVENYPDRRMAAPLGVYHSTVSGEHFPFVPPSETGGHEDTRWIRLQAGPDTELEIASEQPFHFDLHHARIRDYQQAAHDHELPRRPETILHLDAAHGPIGSDMAWSTDMPERYALAGGDYHLSVSLCLQKPRA